MSRWHDEDDVRVQADKLHERTKREAALLHSRGELVKKLREGRIATASRPMHIKQVSSLKAHQARYHSMVKPTLPKIGATDAGD